MAQEITVSQFERNAKKYNKKGLMRKYSDINKYFYEYLGVKPLAQSTKLVLEVTVDKTVVETLIKDLRDKGFDVLGDNNYYYSKLVVDTYVSNRSFYRNVNPEAVQALAKDVNTAIENKKDYKEIENEDTVFYFMPYNEGVSTFFEFVKTTKDYFIKFAKDNDVTIMMKAIGFTNQINGFVGFNFFDADKGDENVVVDFASRMTIGVDFNSKESVYSAGILLCAIGETEEELLDEDINTHIVTETAKYTNLYE
ncbi:MAG: hypothetical protein K6E20_01310 [Acholeplasmatales bacterium]|nr:hypothetical protein [Acholeplasmatales bacterium]